MPSHQLLALIAALLYDRTIEQYRGSQGAAEDAISKAESLISIAARKEGKRAS